MTTASVIARFIDDRLLDGPAGGDALEQGLLDSLAIEQLIAFLENRYSFSFDDEELVPENFESVQALAQLVDAKESL
jgi:acyl carrier protein